MMKMLSKSPENLNLSENVAPQCAAFDMVKSQ